MDKWVDKPTIDVPEYRRRIDLVFHSLTVILGDIDYVTWDKHTMRSVAFNRADIVDGLGDAMTALARIQDTMDNALTDDPQD